MIYIFDYNALVEEDGKTFLVDKNLQSRREGQLDGLVQLLGQVGKSLAENEIPVSLAWHVVNDGTAPLKRWAEQTVNESLKASAMPKFALAEFSSWASTIVPGDILEIAKDARRKAGSLLDGLPIDEADVTTGKDGVQVNVESVKAKIVQGCRREVTEQDQRFADEVAKIAELVRALELKGVNARELVGKYAVAGCPEDDLTKFRDICTRTHAPGTFYTEYVNNELLNKILANGN